MRKKNVVMVIGSCEDYISPYFLPKYDNTILNVSLFNKKELVCTGCAVPHNVIYIEGNVDAKPGELLVLEEEADCLVRENEENGWHYWRIATNEET